MTKVSTVGLEMPTDFPAEEYDKVHALVSRNPLPQPPPDNRRRYAASWNAVAFRFRGCAEYDEGFRESLREHGAGPAPEFRYVQERFLYGFFLSGLSVLDCFCFALHAMGEMTAGYPRLRAPQKEAIWPEDVGKSFLANFPSDGITRTLIVVLNSSEYRQWKGIRNKLAHRAATVRHFTMRAGVPGPEPAAEWYEGLTMEESLTLLRRKWLANVLRELFAKTSTFLAKLV